MNNKPLKVVDRTVDELMSEAKYREFKFYVYVSGTFQDNPSGKKWYDRLFDMHAVWSGGTESYSPGEVTFNLNFLVETREKVDAFIKYARRCSSKIVDVVVTERIFVEPKSESLLVPPTPEELAAMAEEDAIRLEPGYKLIDPLFKYTAFHSLLTACRLPLNSEELRNDPEFGKGLGYDDELGDAWYYFEENEEEYKSYEGYNGFKRDLKRAFLAWNA